MRNSLNYVSATIAVLVLIPSMVWAQESKPVQTASFLDSNTIGYLHADLQELDFGKAFDLFAENEAVLEIFDGASERDYIVAARPMIVGTAELLKKKGAKDAYVFLNLTNPTAISVVIPASDEPQANKFKSVFPPGELLGNNLVIGDKGVAKRLLAFGLPKRSDAESLLKISNGNQATLVIAPSDDHVRVIREVMPDLPEPLDNVDGSMLSDGLQLFVITIDSLAPIHGQIRIKSRTTQASEFVAAEIGELLTAMVDGKFGLTSGKQELLAQVMKTFKPKQSGKVIEVAFEESDFEKLKPAMGGLIEQAASQASKQRIMNRLRELALGMLIFESENRRLPGYANFDKDGKAMLSWRVHILPHLEQDELYKQFHLDESWDSPHNIKLIDKMPKVFRAPGGWADNESAAALAKEGKTVFVMPSGEGMYGTKEGLRIRDVADGTSNTIMLVAVRPELAVPWTKPVDVEIDLADPVPSLIDRTGKGVATAFGDGSTRFLPADTGSKKMRLLLQVADGEIME